MIQMIVYSHRKAQQQKQLLMLLLRPPPPIHHHPTLLRLLSFVRKKKKKKKHQHYYIMLTRIQWNIIQPIITTIKYRARHVLFLRMDQVPTAQLLQLRRRRHHQSVQLIPIPTAAAAVAIPQVHCQAASAMNQHYNQVQFLNIRRILQHKCQV